tara:strand:+ start:149 stop:655 length:507 start_codon:yes stop_codon:yes gene_type:complete
MKTKQKGNLLESIVKRFYLHKGYKVHQVDSNPKRTSGGFWTRRTEDIFGCDLICKKRTEKPTWIQVTGDSATKRKKVIAQHEWNLECEDVFVYRYRQSNKKNSFIIYMLYLDEEDNYAWENISELEINLELMFDWIEEWRVRKAQSIRNITNYLGIDYGEYKVMKKQR